MCERNGIKAPTPNPRKPEQLTPDRRSVSLHQRRKYIDAVFCLQSQPSTSGPSIPGAKSLYDDFGAVHINQTGIIHFTATFLSWHRWYVWTYGAKMRHQCGYTGPLLYWDWGLDALDIQASPVFEGSEYSMSGNGATISHCSINISAVPEYALPGVVFPSIILPVGTGGGCVTSGPFANMSVNLGPVVDLPFGDQTPAPPPFAQGAYRYIPRCLVRDLNPTITPGSLTHAQILALITNLAQHPHPSRT